MWHRINRREGLEAEHGVQGRLPPQPHRHTVVLARCALLQQRAQIQAPAGWFKNMFDAVGDNWKNIRSTFTPIFTSGN